MKRQDTVTAVYVGSVALIILAIASIFPHLGPVVLAGGPIRAAVSAGLVACFAMRFSEAAFWLIFLLMAVEPVMGTRVTEFTLEQEAYSWYYLFGFLILMGGSFADIFFVRLYAQKRAETKSQEPPP